MSLHDAVLLLGIMVRADNRAYANGGGSPQSKDFRDFPTTEKPLLGLRVPFGLSYKTLSKTEFLRP